MCGNDPRRGSPSGAELGYEPADERILPSPVLAIELLDSVPDSASRR